MSKDKVVMFPDRGNPDPVNIEGIVERAESIRAAFVESAAAELFEGVMFAAEAGGFDLETDALTKDKALLYMALVSILNKTRGLNHPMQTMADLTFVEGADGSVFFAEPEQVDLVFTKEGTTE